MPALVIAVNGSGSSLGVLGCPRCHGDVNLDGVMTPADRATITAHLGTTDRGWVEGDLNGDSVVTASDLALVCTADFNCDGVVSPVDILEFLDSWLAGNARADYNGGGVGVQDLLDFLNDWFTGC
ncbi:MAG TPA: GC-type dockerin domain-anchored protein [Phycisphaerales bacterium]|nr:GC-type dockerin domain-anchored protein [Phycisphaerales bacterium]